MNAVSGSRPTGSALSCFRNRRAPARRRRRARRAGRAARASSRRSPSMKPTRPSASRRWSRAASRASIAVIARPAGDRAFRRAMPPATIARRRWRRIVSRWTSSSRPTPSIPATSLRKPSRRTSPVSAQIGRERFGALWLVGRPRRSYLYRRAGGRHSSSSRPARSLANGSPSTIAAKMHPSGRVRLKARSRHWSSGTVLRPASRARSGIATRRVAGADFGAEVVGRGKLVQVAEDGRQALRHRAMIGDPADQMATAPRNCSSASMQPVGHRLVAVAVAQEGEVVVGAVRDRRAATPLRCVARFHSDGRARFVIAAPANFEPSGLPSSNI